jgi:hypothetical protein
MPLREYRPLTREADVKQTGEYRVKYYVLCEGQNTEWFYFTELCKHKKSLGIHDSIEIIPLEKTGEHAGWSNPKKLLELAESKRQELKAGENSTYTKDDRFVIVFDLDIFNKIEEREYKEILRKIKEDEIPVVSNPCYDLWLLLHKANAYNLYIRPNQEDILKNGHISQKHTYTSDLASKALGFSTKGKNAEDFARLMCKVDIAINEEKNICEDVNSMLNKIGCNMGAFIEMLRTKHYE